MDGLEYWDAGSEAYEGLLATKQVVRQPGLPDHLLELVYLHVSQINGCAYCIALHGSAVKEAGILEEQVANLNDWRKDHKFGENERLALAWAEAVTELKETAEIKGQLASMFSPRQIVDLTVAVGVMNALNRVAISLGRSA